MGVARVIDCKTSAVAITTVIRQRTARADLPRACLKMETRFAPLETRTASG
jgi:hypothetical protein